MIADVSMLNHEFTPTADPTTHTDEAQTCARVDSARPQQDLDAASFSRELFTAIPGPIALVDPSGIVLEVNAAWCRLTGAERSDDIGRPLWQRFTPAERTHVAALIERVGPLDDHLADEPSLTAGTQLRRADGRAVDVALRLGAAPDGSRPIVLAQLEPLPGDRARTARRPGTGDRQIALAGIARSVASGGELHRIGRSVIAAVARATGCPLVGLWRRASRHEAFVLADGIGFTAGARRSMVLHSDADGLAEHTLHARSVVVIGGPSGTSARMPQVLLDHGVGSGAAVPVHGSAGADALLTVCAAHNQPMISEDVRFLAITGDLLGMTLQRESVDDLIGAERRRTAEVASELTAMRRRHLLAIDTAGLLDWRWAEPAAVVAERRLNPPPRLSLQTCLDGGPQAIVDSAVDEDINAVAEALNAAFTGDDEFDCSVCLHTTSGIVHVRLRGVIERDQHGRALDICGVATTADPPAPSALPAVRADVCVDDDRLVSVTHDLNNLLAAVLGTAEQLVEHGGDRQQLTAIVHAGRRARELVAGLRDDHEAHPLAGAYELADVVEQLRPLLPGMVGRDVRLIFELGRGACTVQPSREVVEQLLLNLVSNSRDALANGGRIVISTDTCIQLEVQSDEPHAPPIGSWARLRVHDDGVGMRASDRRHVFEHGFTTKQGAQHAGIGLASVRDAVIAAGGVVGLDSGAGRGTTIEVYLPLAAREPVKLQPLRPAALPHGSTPSMPRARVALVADDEPAVRTLLYELLGRLGFDVTVAADGASALRIGRELERLDVVVSDFRMPQLDGLELGRQLRKVHQRTGIVLLSGAPPATPLGDHNLRIVRKPFDWMSLRDAVLAVTLAEPVAAAELQASYPAASG